jgi:hypothetical protein
MPRVQVIADDGWVALDEYANPAQVVPDHARHCLADRIAWAVTDAESHSDAPPEDVSERRSRAGV